MNFLTDKIRPIYFRYLAAAFGSALITSIYGVVDVAMVGQYQGSTGTAALAVVAPVWNIIYSLGLLTGIGGSVLLSTLRGQAPGNEKRSNEYFTAAVFGVIWTLAAELVPNGFVRIFMTPTESILNIAPAIIRSYGISFLLLPFNIFSTYYFQAMMKPATALVVSVGRGAVLSGILIYLLPVAAGADSIWFAMPITELVVAVYVAVMMRRCQTQPLS